MKTTTQKAHALKRCLCRRTLAARAQQGKLEQSLPDVIRAERPEGRDRENYEHVERHRALLKKRVRRVERSRRVQFIRARRREERRERYLRSVANTKIAIFLTPISSVN